MNKYTPGPWVYSTDVGQVGSIETVDGAVIAQAQQMIRGASDLPLREANARLIAAAPELLGALEAAVACGMVPISSAKDGGAVTHSVQVRVADQIRDAIAKAKGESA